MPIPSEWDFRSLRGQSELKVQDVIIRGLVEDAPAVIFLSRTIEKALSTTLSQPALLTAERDAAVAEILINFARVPISEPEPVDLPDSHQPYRNERDKHRADTEGGA